mmetsp:Transcript_12399/g.37839  ORF Transcript_12399/g.37839 Transcript_12399/m.37839 type:complete len:104 (+) Transcript_12399:374-685(+)
MAFVAGSSFVGQKAVAKKAVCSQQPVRRSTARTTTSMVYQKDDKTIVTMKDMKLEEKRQGFTWWSETWNGRMAMLGFVIAVGTEIINPTHPTIVQQVSALFGQ